MYVVFKNSCLKFSINFFTSEGCAPNSETDFTFTFMKSVFLDSSITKNNFHLSDKEQLVLYYYASRLALKKLLLIGSLEPL